MNLLAAASTAEHAAQCFVNKINEVILFPLITLLMALAFLWFLYGAFEYVRNAASDQGREQGKQHLFYGVIGMLIMVSAFGILSLAAGTFNIPLFDSKQIDCSSGPVSIGNSEVGVGGGFGSNFVDTGSGYGGGSLPGGGEVDTLPNIGGSGGSLDSSGLTVNSLPEVDTTSTTCPPNHTRIEGLCTMIYPFTIRNGEQIEVSCLGESSCIGAINACSTVYGGVYGVAGGDDYILCGDSNFSQGPSSAIVYANAPEGLFTAPPELASYEIGIDDPPIVGSFEDGVRFAGTNTFVMPEFQENYNRYVEPYVVESNADEQAFLDTYAEYGVTKVLFMVPQAETQAGATMSQVEGRCGDLNGELTLESGNSRITSVSMYACLQ